jgi:hypothetical protein
MEASSSAAMARTVSSDILQKFSISKRLPRVWRRWRSMTCVRMLLMKVLTVSCGN